MKKSLMILLSIVSINLFAIESITSEDQFNSTVAKEVVVVDFYANWCGPCKKLAPVLDKISNEMDGKVTFAKVDTDQVAIAKKYGVTGLPTVILFKNGKEVARFSGFKSESDVRNFIKSRI